MRMLSESIPVEEIAEQYDSKDWANKITVNKPEDAKAVFAYAELLLMNFGGSLLKELSGLSKDDDGWHVYPPLSIPSLNWEDHPSDKALVNLSWHIALFKKRKQ